MYEERPSVLPGAVVWWTETPRDRTAAPVTPDGCTDLIWVARGLLVAGPDTRPNYLPSPPGTRYVGLRFAPGAGPLVFGVPADELTDGRVPLSALWPDRRSRRLVDRVAEAPRPETALEAAAAEALRAAGGVDPVIGAVSSLARSGVEVSAMADRVGLSERQLHRRCLAAFGYGAKTLARIFRMRTAVDLAREGVPFVDVAGSAGYADQAHMSREVRALTDSPLRALVR